MPSPVILRLMACAMCLGLFTSSGHAAGEERMALNSPRPAHQYSRPVPIYSKTLETKIGNHSMPSRMETSDGSIPLYAEASPVPPARETPPVSVEAPAAGTPGSLISPEPVPRLDLIDDPLEPVNRSLFFFNAQVYRFVISPVGRVYEIVFPRFVRNRFHDFFTNLAFPKYFLSALFQGKFGKSWQEAQRFVINSTAGIGGLFDVAAYTGIRTDPEDFGQTLGYHGVDHGFYLVLPLLGPSSARDGFGLILDAATDLKTYLQFISDDLILPDTVLQFNETLTSVREYERMTGQQYDPYAITRDLYYAYREAKVLK